MSFNLTPMSRGGAEKIGFLSSLGREAKKALKVGLAVGAIGAAGEVADVQLNDGKLGDKVMETAPPDMLQVYKKVAKGFIEGGERRKARGEKPSAVDEQFYKVLGRRVKIIDDREHPTPDMGVSEEKDASTE